MRQRSRRDNELAAKVASTLGSLSAPGPKRSLWNGAYEQLMGAGFALAMADRCGAWDRSTKDYHHKVRQRLTTVLPPLFSQASAGLPIFAVPPSDSALVVWVAGFFFNATAQRLVFCAERLLHTTAIATCVCGAKGESVSGRAAADVAKAARKRVRHAVDGNEGKFESLAALAKQFEGHGSQEWREDEPLRMLRWDVNHRKHAAGTPRHRGGAHSRTPTSWSGASSHDQMRVLSEAFLQVRDAYRECTEWHPNATEEHLSSEGELP